MKINIKEFITVLKKATINNIIKTVQLKFSDGKITSSMISNDNGSISILNIDNNVLNTNDEVDFNFSEPAQEVKPYLDIFDNDEVEIKLYKNKILLRDINQQTNINFCSPMIITLFGKQDVKQDANWFFETKINEDFIKAFNKIKKIGPKFGRVYFEIDNGKFIIETTDKTNEFSNGLKFTLADAKKIDNICLCFTYNDIASVMNVINDEFEKFKIKFTYNEEQELGLLYIYSLDGSEKYCLFSIRE